MRRLTTIVAVLLLLITAAPMMACVTSQTMSHPEAVCCAAMHGKCGAMLKQDCCRTVSHTQASFIAAQSPDLEIHWIALTQVDLLLASTQKSFLTRWSALTADSPPDPLSTQTTVLRI
ncbi:MAG TPA: hypothetical protein VN670_07385 [Acidobacteriaceae bacterium]|nr:hypothetical protein [Acidobacteriaceae bacterium]